MTCLYVASFHFADALSAAVAGSHSWVGAGIKSNAAVGLGLTAWGKVQGVPAALHKEVLWRACLTQHVPGL